MNNNLSLNYTIDKQNLTIKIIREFNTDISTLWQAWTTAELLDRWWGPKPWRAESKILDFHVGGSWLYAMVSPEGKKDWGKSEFVKIDPEKSFSLKGGFSDENGTLNPDLPINLWENTFIAAGQDKVLVEILLTYDSLSDLEKEIEMGFIDGITICFLQLDEILAELKR